MSDYISLEIQVEIMKRLPVKSLLRFRSVSKSWKSLIDSSEFTATYNIRQTQPHLFIWRTNRKISFVDEETFTQQDHLAPTIPLHTELLIQRARVVGSSHGLFCLYDAEPGPSLYNCAMEIAALWNPSITNLVGIAVASCDESQSEIILGFGVCPVTMDPTIVKITQFKMQWDWEMRSWTHNPWVAEVFTLSSGKWKIPSTKLVLKNSVRVTWSQIVIDRFIYWFGFDEMIMDDIPSCHDLIISFDMTTEEFRTISLPKNSEHKYHSNFSISKVSESLAVVERIKNVCQDTCVVWRMDDGVSSSFTKLFSIDLPYGCINTLGFTKSGSIIVPHGDGDQRALAVYDPYSRHVNKIRIVGKYYVSLFVGSYIETLLLIDQLDNSIYVEAGVSVFSDHRPLLEEPTDCPSALLEEPIDSPSGLPIGNRSAPSPLPGTSRSHRFFNFSLLRKLCNIC